jgi:hypothetical protein
MNDRETYELLTRESVGISPGTAMHDVFCERMRQQMIEGFDGARDDRYTGLQLAKAAECYTRHDDRLMPVPDDWPWEADYWKPTTRRRDLVKAAALLLAEIERLDRAAARAEVT